MENIRCLVISEILSRILASLSFADLLRVSTTSELWNTLSRALLWRVCNFDVLIGILFPPLSTRKQTLASLNQRVALIDNVCWDRFLAITKHVQTLEVGGIDWREPRILDALKDVHSRFHGDIFPRTKNILRCVVSNDPSATIHYPSFIFPTGLHSLELGDPNLSGLMTKHFSLYVNLLNTVAKTSPALRELHITQRNPSPIDYVGIVKFSFLRKLAIRGVVGQTTLESVFKISSLETLILHGDDGAGWPDNAIVGSSSVLNLQMELPLSSRRSGVTGRRKFWVEVASFPAIKTLVLHDRDIHDEDLLECLQRFGEQSEQISCITVDIPGTSLASPAREVIFAHIFLCLGNFSNLTEITLIHGLSVDIHLSTSQLRSQLGQMQLLKKFQILPPNGLYECDNGGNRKLLDLGAVFEFGFVLKSLHTLVLPLGVGKKRLEGLKNDSTVSPDSTSAFPSLQVMKLSLFGLQGQDVDFVASILKTVVPARVQLDISVCHTTSRSLTTSAAGQQMIERNLALQRSLLEILRRGV